MLEKNIEQKLINRVQSLGGLCLKLHACSYVGIPDRLVLLPGGICVFVEVKAPDKKPRNIQLNRLMKLNKLGFRAVWINGEEQIEPLLNKALGDKHGV